MSASQLKAELKSMNGKQLIDVRTKAEFKQGNIRNSKNMPLQTLKNNMHKLDKDKPVYVICQTGARSSSACRALNQEGFENVYNIRGGMTAWNML